MDSEQHFRLSGMPHLFVFYAADTYFKQVSFDVFAGLAATLVCNPMPSQPKYLWERPFWPLFWLALGAILETLS